MISRVKPDPWAAAREWVRQQREDKYLSVRQAAEGTDASDQTWGNFEKGHTPLTTKMRKAVAYRFRVSNDWPETLPAVPPDPEPAADPQQAVLAEILRLLQNHRDSDVAPSARLMDMPTRTELQAEMVAAIDAVFRRVDENNTRLVETIGAVLAAVEKNDERIAALEARRPVAATDPSSHTRSRQTHTARSEQGPRKRPD